jgi:hypothetical protein
VTTRTRIAITVACTLALAGTAYGDAMQIGDFGPQGEIWHWSFLAACGLAIVGAFVVYRWWALLPALAPGAVTFYLYEFTAYSTPWDSESVGNPNEPVGYAVLLLFVSAFFAAAFSIGLLLRFAWDAGRRIYMSRTTPHGR